ncbi:hypothetical protein [Butyrivibrio sp.]|uniref:hypothetical protein n=1 Tax=Butyrivibrio sp. TaxID=28121 RepID=UPI0025BDBF11|nr:hypothetical protein [Butyrivibrio sp.]MBE5838087.1 hypothetical protein [Butyrivibrio sp.]
MIDKERARAILQEKMAENLVIVDSYESPDAWCFGLGLINDDGKIMSLMGDSTIRISKETGEME